MKTKIFTLSALFITCFSLWTNVNAQHQDEFYGIKLKTEKSSKVKHDSLLNINFSKNKSVFNPNTTKIYEKLDEEWFHIYSKTSKYDESDKETSSLTMRVSPEEPFEKDTTKYNKNGKIISRTTWTYGEELWNENKRELFEYDSNGNILKECELYFDYETEIWDTAYYSENTFVDNRITVHYDFVGFFGIKFENKIEFIYDAYNVLQEMLFMSGNFEEKELVYVQKYSDLTFEDDYNSNYLTDKIKTAETYLYYENDWHYFGNLSTGFMENGSYIRLYKRFTGSEYVNHKCEIKMYDDIFLAEYRIDIWQNEEWLTESGESNLLIFEDDKLIKRTFRTFNAETDDYTEEKMEEYDYSEITGISKNILNSEITVYPVPARNVLNISFKNSKPENARISIIDLSGNTIFEKYITNFSGNYTLNICHVKTGYYILKITYDNKHFYKNFIIVK